MFGSSREEEGCAKCSDWKKTIAKPHLFRSARVSTRKRSALNVKKASLEGCTSLNTMGHNPTGKQLSLDQSGTDRGNCPSPCTLTGQQTQQSWTRDPLPLPLNYLALGKPCFTSLYHQGSPDNTGPMFGKHLHFITRMLCFPFESHAGKWLLHKKQIAGKYFPLHLACNERISGTTSTQLCPEQRERHTGDSHDKLHRKCLCCLKKVLEKIDSALQVQLK